MQSHRNTPHDLWLDALYDRAASSLYASDTPSGPSSVRAAPPDNRGRCVPYSGRWTDEDCRMYREIKSLHEKCQGCPGLKYEATE